MQLILLFIRLKRRYFEKIDKSGKWIEVKNKAGDEKGWVAGWHTNLNIHADNSKNPHH